MFRRRPKPITGWVTLTSFGCLTAYELDVQLTWTPGADEVAVHVVDTGWGVLEHQGYVYQVVGTISRARARAFVDAVARGLALPVPPEPPPPVFEPPSSDPGPPPSLEGRHKGDVSLPRLDAAPPGSERLDVADVPAWGPGMGVLIDECKALTRELAERGEIIQSARVPRRGRSRGGSEVATVAAFLLFCALFYGGSMLLWRACLPGAEAPPPVPRGPSP